MIGTVFEYICSYFQELWFGTVSWDYSHFLFNLNGRVNLLYSCFWGLLSLAWMKWMYPYLLIEIRKIPKKIGHLLAIFLLIFIIFNSAISALALERQAERRHDVPATTQLDTFLDYHYPDERLLKIYPNMIITSE